MRRYKTGGAALRTLRTVHSWMGFFIFPWIIIIGATGFYLNHWQPILRFVQKAEYDETQFDLWPDDAVVTFESAARIAEKYWPDEATVFVTDYNYHGRPAIMVKKEPGKIIVTKPTGHYFVKTDLTRKTYAPDGELLHSKIYWGSIFKTLHTDGWLGQRLGTWPADITSLAMVVFGFSGIFLWWGPRYRKILRVFRSE